MRIALAGIAAIAALFGTPALAADMPVKAPPAPPPAYNWTGCYVGGNVGGAWGRSNVQIPLYPASFNIDTSNAIGGGQVGCNYMFSNRWVVGIEGDWDVTQLDGSSATTFPGESYFTQFNSVGSVRGRLGYAWDKTLFYVTGGGAWATLHAANFTETAGPCVPAAPDFGGCVSHSATYGGWIGGVGLEYALTANWILGGELLYAGFGRKDFIYNGPVNVNESIGQARARLSYKF